MKSIAITVLASIASAAAATANESFDQTLELQGINFRVQCANDGSLNTLTVTPSGLELDDSPVTVDIDGTVTNAEVADLNADGSPEIYVFISSAGSGAYGSVAAWSANNRKSLSGIVLPELSEKAGETEGYMGHDEFAVVEQFLVRRFPIYREGDTNAAPSGPMRQMQYRLEMGEASWQLVVAKVVEY